MLKYLKKHALKKAFCHLSELFVIMFLFLIIKIDRDTTRNNTRER